MESDGDKETGPGFLTLPYELHLRLFSDLEPVALLQLSQTCKQLHKALSDIGIWKAALRELCHREHLFEPSFPIEEMAVRDLQRAALGPTLWKNKVHRHAKLGSDHPLPHIERSFGGDYEPGLSRRAFFCQVHFVPGGRYLISASAKFITLWDLGPPIPALRRAPSVLNTFSLTGTGWSVNHLSLPKIQSRYLRFGAQMNDWLNTQITYRVYEVGPLPEDTRIREIWKPQIAGESYGFIRVNNWFRLLGWRYVALVKNNCISLCDISHENIFSAALVIPCPEGRGSFFNTPHSVTIVNGYLVAFKGHQVFLWKVPELQWSLRDDSGFSFQSPREPPSFSHCLCSASTQGVYQCSPSEVYPQSESSYIRDFVAYRLEDASGVETVGFNCFDRIEITRRALNFSTPECLGTIPDKKHSQPVPVLLTSYQLDSHTPDPFGLVHSSGRLYTLFLPSCDAKPADPNGRRLYAVMSSPSDDDDSEWALAYLTDLPHWGKDSWRYSASLDPQTGQLAYPCSQVSRDTGLNEIHVIDFQLLSAYPVAS